MRDSEKLSPDKQEEYILLPRQPHSKPYEKYYGWKEGEKLLRVSIWLSGNGCGVRQAYFCPVDRPGYDGTAWEDHVKPIQGQLELEL